MPYYIRRDKIYILDKYVPSLTLWTQTQDVPKFSECPSRRSHRSYSNSVFMAYRESLVYFKQPLLFGLDVMDDYVFAVPEFKTRAR